MKFHYSNPECFPIWFLNCIMSYYWCVFSVHSIYGSITIQIRKQKAFIIQILSMNKVKALHNFLKLYACAPNQLGRFINFNVIFNEHTISIIANAKQICRVAWNRQWPKTNNDIWEEFNLVIVLIVLNICILFIANATGIYVNFNQKHIDSLHHICICDEI